MGCNHKIHRADELDKHETKHQIEKFARITQGLLGPKSLANSAAILGWPEAHADWVRPGIMLYGVSPFDNRTGADEGLKPVMTLQSEIISIQELHKNDAVGYGGTFIAPRDMRIGVVALGYGDGYPRLAPQGTPVLVHGHKASIIGRVSMDMITVDLSQVPEAKVSDPVELWGPHLPVEVVAKAIGTLGYELLTSLSPRVFFV
jgi:alanine racemase